MDIKTALKNAWETGMTYDAYRTLHQKLAKEKGTTGPNQTESLIAYTKLNNSRTKRWEKTFAPRLNWAEQEESISQKWLLITEAWCGDAAQNIPVIQKIADSLPNVETRYILRDENLVVMDEFLTNGGRSIPKLILMPQHSWLASATWGPRPAATLPLLKKYKSEEGYTKDQFSEDIARFYVADNGASLERELFELVTKLTPEEVRV